MLKKVPRRNIKRCIFYMWGPQEACYVISIREISIKCTEPSSMQFDTVQHEKTWNKNFCWICWRIRRHSFERKI